ncbi:glycerol-3-phosphate acyltransferase 1, mitochondrial-like [Tubulanus polymorphus]|uniref:glycerol-3-phosphate acyltransferase 1, mitochondrial-like n=1 Tax=Tubulanus polymorphus TaxID=672921 RepID=UPI003DA31516
MSELFNNLQHVYSKWENRPDHNQQAFNDVMQRGKKAWKTRFSDVAPPPRRTTKFAKPRRFKNQSVGEPSSGPYLCHFKHQPTIMPDEYRFQRPMMGRCCSCMQISRNDLYSDEMPIEGLKDILKVDTSEMGPISRSVCHLVYAVKRNCSHIYPDVTEDVLQSKRLNDAIEKTALQMVSEQTGVKSDSYDTIYMKCQKRASRLLTTMKAVISLRLVRFTGWFLFKVLGRLLSSIIVHRGQMEQLKLATEKHDGKPIVLLPMHRSHLDYILLTFALYQYDIKAPHVAAGNNLNIPVFGKILKGLGGFFIRRKLDRHPNRKDFIYRSMLHSYMHELMREGQYLEFFIEGGRSRSGKALFPKGGLLSVIIDGYLDGVVTDVMLVPISISYERVLDGEFVSEQMGERKKPETFWRAVKAIWNVFMTDFGNVRIDVCQPFSLKEYVQVNQHMLVSSTSRSSPNGQLRRTGLNGMKASASSGSLYGTDIVIDEQRLLVKKLAEHILFNSIHSTAVMSTNLIAFILLTIYRQGTSISNLVESVDWMRVELALRGRDVGFTGKSLDIVLYACDMLENIGCAYTDRKSVDMDLENNNWDALMVYPKLQVPNIFQLTYYSNAVTSAFLMESIIVTALRSAVDSSILVNVDETIKVSKNLVIQNAKILCQFLEFEFIFVPSCTSLESMIYEAFQQLITSEILLDEKENEDPENRRIANHLKSTMSWDDDESDEEDDYIQDEYYALNRKGEVFKKKFPFLLNILQPYVECYWLVAMCLVKLIDSDLEEDQFMRTIQQTALDRVNDRIANYVETCSHEMIKTALRMLQEQKITEIYYIGNARMISLCDSYNSLDDLNQYISTIEMFKT